MAASDPDVVQWRIAAQKREPQKQRVDYHVGGLQDIEDEIELRLQQGWIIIQPPSLAYDLDHKRFAALVVYLVP